MQHQEERTVTINLPTEERRNTQRGFFLNTLIASSLSNMAGTLASHPLDTLKVRMQLDERPLTSRQIIHETIKKEGTFGLFKGVTQPLVGTIPVNAM